MEGKFKLDSQLATLIQLAQRFIESEHGWLPVYVKDMVAPKPCMHPSVHYKLHKVKLVVHMHFLTFHEQSNNCISDVDGCCLDQDSIQQLAIIASS